MALDRPANEGSELIMGGDIGEGDGREERKVGKHPFSH
jgi:hypothetical protein